MSLAKLQRPVTHLAYADQRLGSQGTETLGSAGIETVADLLWQLDAPSPGDIDGQAPVEGPAVDQLVAAARLYLIRGMQSDLAMALAGNGIRSPADLAAMPGQDLAELAGSFDALEHPLSEKFLTELQEHAGELAGRGHLMGQVVDGESGSPLTGARVWIGGVPADLGADGAFAVVGFEAGPARLRATAPDYADVLISAVIIPDRLPPPLTLRASVEVPVPGTAEDERERPGATFSESRWPRLIERRLDELPDDTYLSVQEDGSLLHLFALRRGDDHFMEVVRDIDELPPEADAEAILHLEGGELTMSDMTLQDFARFKAGLPPEAIAG